MHILLVDGDNINPARIRDILDDIKERGPLQLFRLYADFTKPNGWKTVVESNPVDAIQVYSDRKQAVDLRMSVDGIEYVLTHKCTLCIASGDRDFTHLMLKAHQAGVRVIGYATNQSVSDKLRQYCDEFIQFSASTASPPILPSPPSASKKKTKQLKKHINSALERDEKIHPTVLIDLLTRIDSSYNYKNCGFNSFKKWMTSLGFDVDASSIRALPLSPL